MAAHGGAAEDGAAANAPHQTPKRKRPAAGPKVDLANLDMLQACFEWELARQGLTLAHFRAQLQALRDTSLTLELNLSTLGTHPRVNLGYMGDKVSLS